MKWVFEVDEKTKAATLTIDDGEPIIVSQHNLKVSREPVLDEDKSRESGGYQILVPGPRGAFSLEAVLNYGPVNKIKI